MVILWQPDISLISSTKSSNTHERVGEAEAEKSRVLIGDVTAR